MGLGHGRGEGEAACSHLGQSRSREGRKQDRHHLPPTPQGEHISSSKVPTCNDSGTSYNNATS